MDRRLSSDPRTALERQARGGARLITDSTVKSHITHIVQKLGLRDRVQLVVLACKAVLV